MAAGHISEMDVRCSISHRCKKYHKEKLHEKELENIFEFLNWPLWDVTSMEVQKIYVFSFSYQIWGYRKYMKAKEKKITSIFV